MKKDVDHTDTREDLKGVHPLYQWRHEGPCSSFVEYAGENVFPTPGMDTADGPKAKRIIKIVLIAVACVAVTVFWLIGAISGK